MPPQAAVVGVARVVVNGVLGTEQCVNVFHVKADHGGTWLQNQIDALATTVRASYVSRFIPTIVSTYTLGSVVATDLGSTLGLVGTATGSTGGAAVASNVSNQQSPCITWAIPRHYRGGHPRTYLPPAATSQILAGTTWQAAFISAMATAANGFIADIAAATFGTTQGDLVCVHRKLNKIVLSVPLVDVISAGFIDNRVDTQRRRLGPDR